MLFVALTTGLFTPAVAAPAPILEATPDMRDCAWPWCGGWFVRAVNLPKTRCVDGQERAQCYVAELDFTTLGLPSDQQARVVAAVAAGDALLEVTGTTFVYGGTTFAALDATRAFVDVTAP